MLDGIPESVTDYIKAHRPKEGHPDLDNILYRHAKHMVCYQTTYVLCTKVSDDTINITNLSIINDVVEILPKKRTEVLLLW